MSRAAYLSVALFIVSCVMPAIELGGQWQPGFFCLILGWYQLNPAWLANAVYAVALGKTLFPDRRRDSRGAALVLSFHALLLSLFSFQLYDNERGVRYVEGGIVYARTTLLSGCYVWMSSFVALFVANFA